MRSLSFVFVAVLFMAGLSAIAQDEVIEPLPSRECDSGDSKTEKPKSRCGPFIYLSALQPDVGFMIMHVNNPGQVFAKVNVIPPSTTEMKFADDADPSIVLYMPEGRLKFYLPHLDSLSLAQRSWRYKDCEYRIVDLGGSRHTVHRPPNNTKISVPRRFSVEAACASAPKEAVQYLFDAHMGLLAFTFGKLSATGAGETTFIPNETFFQIFGSSGFGAAARE